MSTPVSFRLTQVIAMLPPLFYIYDKVFEAHLTGLKPYTTQWLPIKFNPKKHCDGNPGNLQFRLTF